MKIENASITWLESGLPYSTKFNDLYYSEDDELAESEHVFLNANKLSQRWSSSENEDSFRIAELGFGSGLNFLQVIKLWGQCKIRPSRLHYIGLEKHPLTKTQLCELHKRWPTLSHQSQELLSEYTDHSAGCHRLHLGDSVILDLYFGDGFQQLKSRMLNSCPPIQCWFLDGFSPANNPQLWEEKLMQLLHRCSDDKTTVSSYSVAGKVRRALTKAGFSVEKIDGFGRKRHMLFAVKERCNEDIKQALSGDSKPWFRLPKPTIKGKSAIIIGAGLAGSSTAYSLAQRGWRVKVLDEADHLASGASGNTLLSLRCRLFNAESTAAEFFLHSYLYAVRQFNRLKQERGIPWNNCGVFQLQNAMNKRSPLQAQKLEKLYSEQVVMCLTKELASEKCQAPLNDTAWYFPSAGAIDASALCQAYLEHPNISVDLSRNVEKLTRENEFWNVLLNNSQSKTECAISDIVVIANSIGAAKFEQCNSLPLQAFRGQTTEIASSQLSTKINSVICGQRTVFPTHKGRHLLSASYSNSVSQHSSEEENRENLRGGSSCFAEDGFLDDRVLNDRVSLRCNTPDRLPVVGMVPSFAEMQTSYAELIRNAKSQIKTPGHYLPGLYINVAHGSNGLASCPLSAEYLASLINKENLPLSAAAINSLNPCRFLIRNLQKQNSVKKLID